MREWLQYSPEVTEALAQGRPLVALESTIISHGMPYPQNVDTALEVEEVVRREGAVPATIAISGGKCLVGMGPEQVDAFGSRKDVEKCATRDIPFALTSGIWGATTVSATMRIAHWAGISVFATGGIGGVHRGASESFDISADLEELRQTPVVVVSAGIKSILDVGATLEYLETAGVPVIAWKQESFPCFYAATSPYPAPFVAHHLDQLAQSITCKWQLGLNTGCLVANPLPAAYALPYADMEVFIQVALEAAAKEKISGKPVTPFLLKHLATATGGRSLEANMALIKSNAALAAQLAVTMKYHKRI